MPLASIDEVEGHAGRRVDQFDDALGVTLTRHLDEDARIALAGNGRLGQAGFVNPAADDFDRLRHRPRLDFRQRLRRDRHADGAFGIVACERHRLRSEAAALPGNRGIANRLGQVLNPVPGGVHLVVAGNLHDDFLADDGGTARVDDRFAAQDHAGLFGQVFQPAFLHFL